MVAWVGRLFFVFAGFISSWFVAEDALHFPILQMIITVLLFTLFIVLIAFRSEIKRFFGRFIKK